MLISSVFHRDSSEPMAGFSWGAEMPSWQILCSNSPCSPEARERNYWSFLWSELFLQPFCARLDYLWQLCSDSGWEIHCVNNHRKTASVWLCPEKGLLSHSETCSQQRFFTHHLGGEIFWVPTHRSPGSKLPVHNECIIINSPQPLWEQRDHISKINRAPGYWVSRGVEHCKAYLAVKISKKGNTKSVFNTWTLYHFHFRQVFSTIAFRN